MRPPAPRLATTILENPVILSCNFEELRALASGAELLLHDSESAARGSIAAPAEALAQVALLQPRLTGSLTIDTLEEQRCIRSAIEAICTRLHERMDEKVLEHHPAHEEAVALYFDYAHAYGVLRRLDELGTRMKGMIELMTGEEPTEESAKGISFPE